MQKLKLFYRVGFSFLGAFLMGVLLSCARYFYYIYQEIEPNMSPFFFIIFSPVVSFFFAFFGMVFELVINKIGFCSRSNFHSFVYGACYALPLLYLIDWRLLFVMIFVNPFVFRYLFGKKG